MKDIGVFVSKTSKAAVTHTVTVPAAMNGAEVAKVFDLARNQGVRATTSWGHGEESGLHDPDATFLYFETLPDVFDFDIVRNAIEEVVSQRSQA